MVPHMHTSKGQADFSINSSRAGRLLLLIPLPLSRLDLRLTPILAPASTDDSSSLAIPQAR